MNKLILLALLVASAYAGEVNWERCGGVGSIVAIRVEGCDGDCTMIPGTAYPCEGDIIPAAAHESLTLIVTVEYLGFPIEIINSPLPGSSVQPGQMYTVTFTITPNDILTGNTVPADVQVFGGTTEEVCGRIQITIA